MVKKHSNDVDLPTTLRTKKCLTSSIGLNPPKDEDLLSCTQQLRSNVYFYSSAYTGSSNTLSQSFPHISEPSNSLPGDVEEDPPKQPRGRFSVTDKMQHTDLISARDHLCHENRDHQKCNHLLCKITNPTFKGTHQRKRTIFILTVPIRKVVHFYRATDIVPAKLFHHLASIS